MTYIHTILPLLVCSLFLGCNKQQEKIEQSPKGKKAYFKRLLKDPTTGEIPKNFKEQNLTFLRSQLATRNVNNADYTWQQAGPNNIGGRTRAISVASNNANLVFAGAETGGIWKSTDKGASWSFKTPQQFSLDVTSIAQHPTNLSTWFYAAEELFKSTDNGDTWTKIHDKINGNAINKIILHPQTGNIYVASGNSVHKSTDGGTSFTEISSTISTETYQIANDGKIYLLKNETGGTGGGSSSKGLYVSSDNGTTFTKKMDIPQATLDLPLLRFRIPKTITNTAWLIGLDMDDNNKTALKINLTNNTLIDRSANLPNLSTFSGHCFVVKTKPNNADVLIIGGINLYRSTNGLSTPFNASTGTITGTYPDHHVDQLFLCWDSQSPNAFWSGHDGGMSYTTDYTTSNVNWINKNNKYITTQFYNISIPPGANDARVMGGTQDNSLPFIKYDIPNYNTPDHIGGDGFTSHFGQQYNYQSTQNGEIVALGYKANGEPDFQGASYGLKVTSVASHPVSTRYVVDPTESYMVYLAGNQIWRRNNLASQISNNNNWQHLSSLNLNGTYTAISLSKQNNVLYYAGTLASNSNPQLFKLANANSATSGAVNITPLGLVSGSTISSIGISPLSSDTFLVCTSNNNGVSLNYSSDGGTSYQSVIGNLSGNPAILSTLISHYNGTTRYWAGTSAGLYCAETLNGNSTQWNLVAPEYFGLAQILDLKSRTSDGLIAVASYGRGIVIGKNQDPLSVNEVLVNVPKIFPNPTKNGKFILQLGNDINNASLQIFNLNGQLVSTQKLYQNKTEVNVGSLSKGIYLLNTTSGNKKWSSKLIYQ